jgi:hypothetical protein
MGDDRFSFGKAFMEGKCPELLGTRAANSVWIGVSLLKGFPKHIEKLTFLFGR